MQEHDDVCVCFHVSLNKIRKFVRLSHPKLPTQISECYGAGTGCGWCIPFLEKIFEAETKGEKPDLRMTREEYRRRRKAYHEEGSPRKRR
jgi:bacterioferritin-associated ferredoxin